MKLNGDTNGIESYIGGVRGILKAVQSPAFQGDFADYSLKHLRKKFMADTIAANLAGNNRIQHVFEWPAQDGEGVSTGAPSGIPLFRLKIMGTNKFKVMSFDFLPSTRSVPLPDPDYYGFKAEKLQFLRRHVFTMKAAVMENSPNVVVAPRMSRKLFIPSRESKYGYYMTSVPQEINPGGRQATGGFAEWWTMWFQTTAESHLEDITRLAEDLIRATGQKVARYAAGTVVDGKKVGGQFARGTTVSMGYVDAAERAAQIEFKQAAKFVFEDEDDEWGDV